MIWGFAKMRILEKLEQEIIDSDIELIETNIIDDKSAILKDFEYEYPTVIAINKKR